MVIACVQPSMQVKYRKKLGMVTHAGTVYGIQNSSARISTHCI
jgi:hypothetical protein